jgi:hypothetical protein
VASFLDLEGDCLGLAMLMHANASKLAVESNAVSKEEERSSLSSVFFSNQQLFF